MFRAFWASHSHCCCDDCLVPLKASLQVYSSNNAGPGQGFPHLDAAEVAVPPHGDFTANACREKELRGCSAREGRRHSVGLGKLRANEIIALNWKTEPLAEGSDFLITSSPGAAPVKSVPSAVPAACEWLGFKVQLGLV